MAFRIAGTKKAGSRSKYYTFAFLVLAGLYSLYLLKFIQRSQESSSLELVSSPSNVCNRNHPPSWIRTMFQTPCKRQGFSQGNQDCMLDIIFDKIGTTNKYFVEYGFNTHRQCDASGPNTCKLWKKHGWNGLLLDGSHENARINLQKHFLYRDNIVGILQENKVPVDMDFLSSDMDSHDYFVLEAILEKYKPRVVTTEYNRNWPVEWEMSQIDPTLDPDLKQQSMNSFIFRNCVFGASAYGLRRLMEKHGYRLIGISEPTYLDLIWARAEIVDCYDIPSFDEFMPRAQLGSNLHKNQLYLEFLDWLADTKVWQETGDIDKARSAAKQKLVAGAKAGTLGDCFSKVQGKLAKVEV